MVAVEANGRSSSSSSSSSSSCSRVSSPAYRTVVQRIAAIVEETMDGSSPDEASNVLLTSSGMSAIFTALRLALACHQEMMTTMMLLHGEVRSDDDSTTRG